MTADADPVAVSERDTTSDPTVFYVNAVGRAQIGDDENCARVGDHGVVAADFHVVEHDGQSERPADPSGRPNQGIDLPRQRAKARHGGPAGRRCPTSWPSSSEWAVTAAKASAVERIPQLHLPLSTLMPKLMVFRTWAATGGWQCQRTQREYEDQRRGEEQNAQTSPTPVPLNASPRVGTSWVTAKAVRTSGCRRRSTETLTIVANLSPPNMPVAVAVTPDGSRAYLAMGGGRGSLAVIDSDPGGAQPIGVTSARTAMLTSP